MTSFFIYLLKVSILSALFIGLFHLLLRRETFHRTNRIILVSSLVLSYILPLCVITVHRQGKPTSGPVASRNIQDEQPVTKEPFEPVITTGSVYASEPEVNSESAAAAENLTQVIEVTGNDRTAEPVVKKQRVRINWWKLLGAVYVIGLLCVLIIRLISTSKVMRIIRKGNVI